MQIWSNLVRRADRILVSGVRIGRLFLLFSLPLLLALRYRPALSEAESCTEKPNFPPQVIAAPFNCGHVLFQSKCTAQPVEDLRVSAVPRTGLPLSPGGVSKGEGRRPPLCAQRGYGGRWLTPLRHYDSRPLRAANRAVSSKSGRLIRRWRRLSRFPPCFRWGFKGGYLCAKGTFPLPCMGIPLAGARKKRSHPNTFGTRAQGFVVPPKFGADCPLWPSVTGREPWTFPSPLRRCPSSGAGGILSA